MFLVGHVHHEKKFAKEIASVSIKAIDLLHAASHLDKRHDFELGSMRSGYLAMKVYDETDVLNEMTTQEKSEHLDYTIDLLPARIIAKFFDNELKKLEEQDIVEKVANQPTPWISPIVVTPKKDGDMREANQAIERETHTMPTLQDFKAEVNGTKFFSKIDLKQAYHQLELHPDSRFITTFSTHAYEGLFQYKRLNYGTNSAAEIFQNVLQQNLSDIRGVIEKPGG
ncbi:Hypothetical predicted protein [Paramuricea clavata]|uniref:Reverse transcriptase domain-containing protein n=1 Tax=Paramuricea clavata TaxID=317549 RepID=A0A6S7GM61_PARCT|nr:Hypothetical predicted protein [Paramuricea clavata]